ncbi:amidohydrolase family protein, partial [Candidatus Aerophobetes bacterium]|nr:amidohydrolase family protein [Candidatus Aerophobetes bacterium]
EDVKKQHDRILGLCKRYPGRFYGMANPNPHLPEKIYEAEFRRCITKLKFVGVKLHPFAHAVNPLGHDGRKVFSLATKLRVPVMVHTGSGIPWSEPSLLHAIAEEYATVKIIIAHAGMMVFASEAAYLAKKHANVFLECSWTAGFLIKQWIRDIGKDKIMFGSDHADNAATELTKYRTTGLTNEEIDWTLGKTAKSVFKVETHFK